jgi:hypothetical protein
MDSISQAVLDEMGDVFHRGPFVLFLGAGVNGNMGLLWNDLVAKLEEEAIHLLTSGDEKSSKSIKKHMDGLGLDVSMRAEMTARVLGSTAYRLFLKQKLYSKFKYQEFIDYMAKEQAGGGDDEAEKYHLLWMAATLTQSRNLVAVLTLNYDNYLEMAAQRVPPHVGHSKRRPICMIPERSRGDLACPGEPMAGWHDSLPVFHLHGFLPYPSPDLTHDTQDIVLVQRDYLRSMRETMSPANCTAVHMLTSYPVLFVGLSMTDWNLLRQVEASQVAGRKFDHYWLGPQSVRRSVSKKSLLLYDGMVRHMWDAYSVKSVFAGREYRDVRTAFMALVSRLMD